MADNMNVSKTGAANTSNASSNDMAQAMVDALKSGDVEAALSAMQSLLNSRGAKMQGKPSADKLKQGLDQTRSALSTDESSACDDTLKAATPKPDTTTTTASTAEKPAVDPNASGSARRFAQTAERARQAALLTRVDVEHAGNYVGVWNPQVAQQAITELDGRQQLLEGEKKNVGDAMTELGGQIKTLDAKSNKSDAEQLNLEAKKGQLTSFQMLDKALDGRIQQMKAAKGALKFDNFNNETGKNEISRDEAQAIAQHGNVVDKETVAACQLGRKSDSLAIRAEDLANQQAAKPDAAKPDAAKPDAAKPDAAKPDAAKPDAAKPTVAATKPDATAAAQKPVVDVKEGQWLSRICANAKNKDGSKVTLDQLRQQPENKPIFDRAASGDVLKVGDKVTLPDGATCPWATSNDAKSTPASATPSSDAKSKPASATPSNGASTTTSTSTAKSGPRKGLTKTDPTTTPKVDPAKVDPAKVDPAKVDPAKVDPAKTETFAKLSDKQVNDAVQQVSVGVGAKKGSMTDVNKVFDAMSGMSPNQVQQVKDAYNAKFGAQGWNFDKNVTGAMHPWNQRAMQALAKGDQKSFEQLRTDGKKLDAQVNADSDALFKAVDGAGTDENAIFSVLKKNAGNPEMRAAVERDYAEKHGGESLRDRLDSELKDVDFGKARNGADDAARAKALLDGDTNKASACLLHSLLADGSRNPQMALQVMTKELTPDRRKAVADAFRKQYGVAVEDLVQAQPMMGTDDKARLLRAAKDLAV